jgi:hypothetical protein
MLNWLVHERGIEPHIPMFDRSKRKDGTFSREDFTYDHQATAIATRVVAEIGIYARARRMNEPTQQAAALA